MPRLYAPVVMSHRTEQISSVIRASVQRVITRGLNDPRIRGLISVTKVEVAPDLSEAWVYVSVLPAEHAELTMHGLRSAARHIQTAIAKDVAAKRLPRLAFRLDESLKKQAQLDAAIAERADDEENEPSAPENANNDPFQGR
jgi:ribosome-binding factor A